MAGVSRAVVSARTRQVLESHEVPILSLAEACSGCANPQDEDDVDGYPKGFDTDWDSEMLGSVKNYGRQILISTARSDWPREVTAEGATLAGLVNAAYADSAKPPRDKAERGLLGKLSRKLNRGESNGGDGAIPGVFPSSTAVVDRGEVSGKLSILNASTLPSSCDDGFQTVIVLPDFKVVEHVPETKDGARELVEGYLKPDIGRAGAAIPRSLKSWPLPYHAVVLLCSHKRRDNRCHIAAPLLISQFHHHLGLHGLEGDERGDDLIDGPPIEEWDASTRELKLEEHLKGVKRNGGRVGLWKVSHIGGHRYAGNLIIYFPSGSCVWYGRVTPRDVGVVVETTIMQGRVIPEFLRGGLGLAAKTGTEGVLQW